MKEGRVERRESDKNSDKIDKWKGRENIAREMQEGD
jgi:hypothetical protein